MVKTKKKKDEGLPHVIEVYWLFFTFHGTWERNGRGEIMVRGLDLDWGDFDILLNLQNGEKRLEVELVVASNHTPTLKLFFRLFFKLKTCKLSIMVARGWRRASTLYCVCFEWVRKIKHECLYIACPGVLATVPPGSLILVLLSLWKRHSYPLAFVGFHALLEHAWRESYFIIL